MIRCYQCFFYKETSSRKKSGICEDTREGKKKIKVDAVDFCNDAKEKTK